MRRKIRKLEEKDQDTIVIKKFDLDTGKKVDLITGKKVDLDTGKKVDLDTEKNVDTAVIDTFDETKSEIKKSIDLVEGKYDELKVNGMKTDKEKLK
ncbi:hypothetical protein DPMN_194514 [Dreissena polymorpha]|uniref:Uncharacterized protein n=1 Tax=Dreissena polymorpha TaxID=45954 RepID=A0A9D3Y526_DREPO|nr:hypothetical protein DPMN_194514 [Dreissena polymorpha]